MAARRGKTQARRNQGNSSGLPGWAWMVLGVLLTIIVVLVAPKYLKSDGDGFFRPQPNPDAEPAPTVAGEDEAVANDTSEAATPAKPKAATAANKDSDYDFYTLLPGKEVPMSDAELAASERAEAQRQAPSPKPAAATPTPPAQTAQTAPTATATLPKPVDSAPTTTATTTPAATTGTAATTATAATPADDGTRYLLQAGAFQASGQAEEMKARIAMLGLGARVEAASIGGKTVYRVRMGPYGTASDLAEAKRKLAGGGLPALAIKVK